MAAARAWVAGQLDAGQPSQSTEPEAIADARLWGASEAEIAGLRQHLAGSTSAVAVWRGNVETVLAFQVSGTQWRTGLDVISGRLRTFWIGLDYASARVSIAESGIAITPALWTGVRIMEQAALDALNGETVH